MSSSLVAMLEERKGDIIAYLAKEATAKREQYDEDQMSKAKERDFVAMMKSKVNVKAEQLVKVTEKTKVDLLVHT